MRLRSSESLSSQKRSLLELELFPQTRAAARRHLPGPQLGNVGARYAGHP